MGSAILGGILDATRADGSAAKISRFVISTKSAQSAKKLQSRFKADEGRARFLHGQNVQAMQDADIVILGFKPYMAKDVLQEDGVREALRGKVVVSVLAGITGSELREFVYGPESESKSQTQNHVQRGDEEAFFIRVHQNVAASIRQSMTIIETPDPSLPQSLSDVLVWMFEQIGLVKFVPADQYNAACMLVGASMAIMSTPLDGILDGGVAVGVRRAEGMEIMAQVLSGMAGLLKSGVHPAVLREEISSPRGCTIRSLLRLEREGVRGSCAQALIDGVEHLEK